MTASTMLDLHQVVALRRRVIDPVLSENALAAQPACTAECGRACAVVWELGRANIKRKFIEGKHTSSPTFLTVTPVPAGHRNVRHLPNKTEPFTITPLEVSGAEVSGADLAIEQ